MFNFLKKLFETKYNGAFDNRSIEEKSKDYKWSEVSTLGAIQLEERAPLYEYTVRNQDGSGSCVAQTVAKMLEVWDFKHDKTPTVYSATPIYQNRVNKPQGGMVGTDALGLAVGGNVYLEWDVTSQKMTDTEMDSVTVDISKKQTERPTNYLVMPIDFYAVIQEVQKNGSAMVWFKCSMDEWNQDVPAGISASEAVRHSVTAVDAILWKGVEYIIIEDSWGTFLHTSDIPLKAGQRAISREFFNAHCFFTAAFTTFYFVGGDKPKYQWSSPMVYGMRTESVRQLQLVLKYEKFFPSNQECTGYFGGITAKALVQWQVAHDMIDFKYEANMRKVRAGAKTLAVLNQIYG